MCGFLRTDEGDYCCNAGIELGRRMHTEPWWGGSVLTTSQYCIVLSCLVLCYTGGCGHRTDSHAGAGTVIIRSLIFGVGLTCPVSSTRIAGERHFENSVRWVLILISEMTLAVLWISLSFEFAGTLLPL